MKHVMVSVYMDCVPPFVLLWRSCVGEVMKTHGSGAGSKWLNSEGLGGCLGGQIP